MQLIVFQMNTEKRQYKLSFKDDDVKDGDVSGTMVS